MCAVCHDISLETCWGKGENGGEKRSIKAEFRVTAKHKNQTKAVTFIMNY